jgi:threonine dehydrogenase-like Zn-dependent dehydrogenase
MVAVVGCGGVGLNVVQCAALRGPLSPSISATRGSISPNSSAQFTITRSDERVDKSASSPVAAWTSPSKSSHPDVDLRSTCSRAGV